MLSLLIEKQILPQISKDLEEFNFDINLHALNEKECGLSISNNKNSYWVSLSDSNKDYYKIIITDNSNSNINSKLEDNILIFEEHLSKDLS